MARPDAKIPRLHVAGALKEGEALPLDKPQAHYLCNVLRMTDGDAVLLFNGRDGEWRASLSTLGKRDAAVTPFEQSRAQTRAADLHYWFAPLKHERLDYMVQKAVEMGVSRLQPVITRRTQTTRLNLDRMKANAIEAAEQCGLLAIPDIGEPVDLTRALEARKASRLLVFCDEEAEAANPVEALAPYRPKAQTSALVPSDAAEAEAVPMAVLIGPEGGFADEERALLLASDHHVRLSLGPRILRADTAAVAALSVVQAALGYWR